MSPQQQSPQPAVVTTKKAGQVFTQKVLEMMLDSIDDNEVLTQIKAKLVHPMLHSVFTQLYPYLIFVLVLIGIVLIMNCVCCSLFIVHTCVRRNGSSRSS